MYKDKRGHIETMSEHTISINGVHYDANSGLPNKRSTAAPAARHAASVHHKTQRSTTLNRHFTTQPAKRAPKVASASTHAAPAVAHARHPQVAKFARNPQPLSRPPRTMQDIAPATHPHVAKAHHVAAAQHAQPVAHHTPARVLKDQAIATALANAAPAKKAPKKAKFYSKRSRIVSVASASLAVALLAGYFTYLNMPALSVRVAAAQAGIDASYPEYRPSGYQLNGPVAYSGGQVSMKFKATAGPQQFALNQSKSSWDSTALLANYVDPASKGDYSTYSDAGITVYTFGSNAAWVNGGILYTLDGDAPLSNDQIRHIATSM